MQIYEVIPISKGIGKETLSYFGADNIELGSLVSIPLRKKSINAIVVGSREIAKEKASIKSSPYTLRKIESVKAKYFISSTFLGAARETAEYFATTTGAVLQTVLPKQVVEELTKKEGQKTKDKKESSTQREPLIFQAEDEERITHYKSFIREEFARKSSVYVCLPNIEDIYFYKKELEKGISEFTAILHGSLSKKEFKRQIEIIEDPSHPILILGTPAYLGFRRDDVSAIVLERENSRGYRTQGRPFIDFRFFTEKLAQNKKIKLILGDLVLSAQTLWRFRNEELLEFSPLKSRYLAPINTLLVDMSGGNAKPTTDQGKKSFEIISRELESLIDKTIEDSERLVIYCARKGLSPITVCGDCGQVVSCSRCGSPMVLYGAANRNVFKCNRCGEARDSLEKCSNCGSWKLTTLGVAIERVEQEIKKKFPKAKVFRLDKESVKTPKKATELVKKFESEPGSILLGTEYLLFHFKNKVENVAVASIDTLFALPDYSINERIFYLLLTLKARAEKVFIIQTRNAAAKTFEYALKGNLADFYLDEIKDRYEFNYPPYCVIIKLSLEGRKPAVSNEAQKITLLLSKWNPVTFQGQPSSRGNTVMNIIVRLKPRDWPNEEILRIILSLPPQVAVRVDPESLL